MIEGACIYTIQNNVVRFNEEHFLHIAVKIFKFDFKGVCDHIAQLLNDKYVISFDDGDCLFVYWAFCLFVRV